MTASSMTRLEFDPGADEVVVFNDSDQPDDRVLAALGSQYPEFKSLADWAKRSQADGLFERDRFSSPHGIFAEMRIAKDAVETDDTTSGVADTTEQIAFNRVQIECDDPDEQDVWNQILDDINIEARMRSIWREQFTTSNTYVATLMGRKKYKPQRPSETGQRRKKEYNLKVPIGLTILSPFKVVPYGSFMFQSENLAYIASRSESGNFKKILDMEDDTKDPIVEQLMMDKLTLPRSEIRDIKAEVGDDVDLSNLYELNPERTFRITATRPDYERFATVRMKSVFELLDIKAKLRQMDRAHLIGATNFIILVTKGSDEHPARPEEMAPLAAQVRVAARVPIIVGDHRLKIEIITPKLDKTLSPERYNALDARITARLYQIFSAGNYASGTANDDSIKLLRVVARSMEARRNIIKDEIFAKVIRPAYEANEELKSLPRIVFYPRRISLDFDNNVAQFLLDLRSGGDISRETILAELDIIQSEEASKRRFEAEHYDDDFPQPIQPGAPAPDAAEKPDPEKVPGATKKVPAKKAPAAKKVAVTPTAKRQAGRKGGGNSNGGGRNRDSFKSQPGRGPATQ